MPPNDRQERRLMRQRGAGPRELKNASFDFNFGAAPLPAQRSGKKTPKALPARPSSAKTPQPLAPRTSTRKTPAESSAKASGSSRRSERSESAAVSTASRDDIGGAEKTPGEQTFKTPAVTGKRKRGKSLAVVDEAEHDELEPNEEDLLVSRPKSVRRSIEGPLSMHKTPVARTPVEPEEEDELSPDQLNLGGDDDDLPTQSIFGSLQTPSLPAPRINGRPAPSPEVTRKDRRISGRGRSRTRKSVTSAVDLSAFAQQTISEEGSEDELSPRTQLSANITKSDIAARQSSSGLALATENLEGLTATLTVPDNESTRREVFDISDEEPSSDDELTPAQPNKRRRSSANPIDIHEDDTQKAASEDEDELSPQQTRDELKRRDRPPLSQTTANTQSQRKAEKPSNHTTSLPNKKHKAKSETSGTSVPITVYRRTRPKDIDDDPLGADPTPSLNPVDVLSQITSELATNYITAYAESGKRSNGASKKTLRNQINALTSFRDTLQDSFFDLTIAHNSSYILAARVRKANKEKRRLREELMARRREREELEVEIDRVRKKHREVTEKEERRQLLVQNLHDIEMAVQRGRERAREEGRDDEEPEEGVEMLVGSIVDLVGVKGGMLERVRDWNGVLENTARVLEERA